MLIINDLHFSFNRKAGTTPASQQALRAYQYELVRQLLDETTEIHVLVLGDLFDAFYCDNRDLLDVFTLLVDKVVSKGRRLTLVAGNHDVSARGEKISSFSVLCAMLTSVAPQLVDVVNIDEVSTIVPGVIAVAHASNQDIFDQKLAGVLATVDDGDFVLLHANYASPFAQESDHSLNVTEGLARKFAAAGATLVFAHEHQAKKALGGKVRILGNQVGTSVADCLGNDEKFAHVLKDGELTKVRTWGRDDAIGGFAEIDWRDLDGNDTDAGFVRVTGDATSNEASEVINAISKFRSKSDAFVLTNAVKIDGVAEVDALPANFEAVKKFDVLDFVRKNLDADEYAVVEELMKEDAA